MKNNGSKLKALLAGKEGAIFDLDGVIIFTDRYHYLGWKRLADEEGWHFDEELNHQLRGVSRMHSLQIILDHNHITLSEEEKLASAERKNKYYRESLQHLGNDDILEGAIEFVQSLRDAKVRVSLASGSRNAHYVLTQLNLLSYFDAIVTGDDVSNPKPDPQIFLLAASRIQIAPEQCVVFEDAASGIEAAHRAGMEAIGVGDPEKLAAAELIISGFSFQ